MPTALLPLPRDVISLPHKPKVPMFGVMYGKFQLWQLCRQLSSPVDIGSLFLEYSPHAFKYLIYMESALPLGPARKMGAGT